MLLSAVEKQFLRRLAKSIVSTTRTNTYPSGTAFSTINPQKGQKSYPSSVQEIRPQYRQFVSGLCLVPKQPHMIVGVPRLGLDFSTFRTSCDFLSISIVAFSDTVVGISCCSGAVAFCGWLFGVGFGGGTLDLVCFCRRF